MCPIGNMGNRVGEKNPGGLIWEPRGSFGWKSLLLEEQQEEQARIDGTLFFWMVGEQQSLFVTNQPFLWRFNMTRPAKPEPTSIRLAGSGMTSFPPPSVLQTLSQRS